MIQRTSKDIQKIVKAGLMRNKLASVATERKGREKAHREESGSCHFCRAKGLLKSFHHMFNGQPVCDPCAFGRGGC